MENVQTTLCNVVLLFSQDTVTRGLIDLSNFLGSFGNRAEIISWANHPLAPGHIQIKDTKTEIIFMGNSIQIQLPIEKDSSSFEPFINDSIKILNNLPKKSLVAFGFNWDFIAYNEAKLFKNIAEKIKTEIIGDLSIATMRLIYSKDNVVYTLDLVNSQPINIHINAHHQTTIDTTDLNNKFKSLFEKDYSNSLMLVKEVLKNE